MKLSRLIKASALSIAFIGSQPAIGADAKLSADDKKFVTEAGHAGAAEVEAGKMAEKKAVSADVKAFGKRMAEDHAKANTELKKVAGSAGMTPPAEPDPARKAEAAKLEKLSGAAFDTAYIANQVVEHEKAVDLFKTQANTGTDPRLKSFAAKTLPTLEQHLDHVKTVKSKTKS